MSFLVYDSMMVITLYLFCFGLSLLESYPFCRLDTMLTSLSVIFDELLNVCVVTVLYDNHVVIATVVLWLFLCFWQYLVS